MSVIVCVQKVMLIAIVKVRVANAISLRTRFAHDVAQLVEQYGVQRSLRSGVAREPQHYQY